MWCYLRRIKYFLQFFIISMCANRQSKNICTYIDFQQLKSINFAIIIDIDIYAIRFYPSTMCWTGVHKGSLYDWKAREPITSLWEMIPDSTMQTILEQKDILPGLGNQLFCVGLMYYFTEADVCGTAEVVCLFFTICRLFWEF